MLQLSLVRHAEAASTAAGNLDRHRILTEAGRRTAEAMGQYLRREGLIPDQILSSDAVRAIDTAHLILDGVGEKRPVVVLDALYGAEPDQVIMLIQSYAHETARHLMIVGHNPTLGALAFDLAGDANASIGHFAPAACARFAVSSLEWESFHKSHATLRRITSAADYG